MSDTPTSRVLEIEEIVNRFLKSKQAIDEVVGLHPELQPELGERLKIAQMIRMAEAEAINAAESPTIDHQSSHVAEAAKSASGRSSLGLHIVCPHCSNPVELLVNTAAEDVSCDSCGSFFNLVDRNEQTMASQPLQRVGRFELVSRLGIGGFGSVWKARDTDLDRIVAIKIPRKSELSGFDIDQFFREARAVAQFRHPNIVPVHEIGKYEGTIFIVCDLIRGVPLSGKIAIGKMPPNEVVRMLQKVALALHHAHDHGVIHRDLKPSNVMIDTTGEPILMDFGLAKRETNEVTMTLDGQVMGTPSYMSPEQADGKGHQADRRSDIYSLGVMLFQMLTNELPFRGNVQMQIFQRLTEDPPDPQTLNKNIPKDLATICLKCLERDPNRRYSSAKQVADEFLRYLNGHPILARPISRVERALRWMKRNPAIATAATLTAILAIAGPMAAWRINADKNRLDKSVAERDVLIDRISDSNEKYAKKTDTLESQLAAYETKTDARMFWSPPEREAWRQTLLQHLYKYKAAEIERRIATADLQEQAAGEFALAVIAEAADELDESSKWFRSSIDSLKKNVESDRDNSHWATMLAFAHMRLARVTHKQAAGLENPDRDVLLAASDEALKKSAESYAQLDEELHRPDLLGIAVSRDDDYVDLFEPLAKPEIKDLSSFYDYVQHIETGVPRSLSRDDSRIE